jgi:hypothetical protein
LIRGTGGSGKAVGSGEVAQAVSPSAKIADATPGQRRHPARSSLIAIPFRAIAAPLPAAETNIIRDLAGDIQRRS